MADRIAIRPEGSRRPLTHDNHRRATPFFVSGEVSPANDWDLEQGKIRAGDKVVERLPGAAVGGSGRDRRKAAAEGRVGGGGEATHVRSRPENVEHSRAGSRMLLEIEPNDATSVQADVEVLHAADATQQDAGADEQQHTHRDLSDDERIAQARRPKVGVEIASCGLDDVGTRRL